MSKKDQVHYNVDRVTGKRKTGSADTDVDTKKVDEHLPAKQVMILFIRPSQILLTAVYLPI